jgi:glycosyltransferase involved in cell wall biosynthesis
MDFKLTLCTPCYERPQRTLRALESVVEQDMNGWEAYFVGDACADFQKLLDTCAFDKYIEKAESNGNKIYAYNLPTHSGGWGFNVRNHIFSKAIGKYVLFMDNDDVILRNHFSLYYNSIQGTDYDFAYLNTYLDQYKHNRKSELQFGSIGHHEIIIRNDFLKRVPMQKSHYGHDWTLIEDMINLGAKSLKVNNIEATYIIKGVGEFRNDEID